MGRQEGELLLKRIGRFKIPYIVDEYEALGGFSGLKKAVKMEKETILKEIDLAKLRGRGGAAYPAGKKWNHLYYMEKYPKYIVCNADEGEPGTFKDKILLEQDPLSIIEGMIIAGYLFAAEAGFIYIRGEYRGIQNIVEKALESARTAGYLGKNIMGIKGFHYDIHVVSGAGAYVCGENSALLNSIEGKTGRPRVKPPHLAECGLYGMPTLVNNVESFACIPVILTIGGNEFLSIGTPQGGGTKLVCLSGHVKNRGTYEVPLGASLHDILYSEKYGGGSATGRPIKFCHFGGQSGPIGYADKLDILYSYEGMWDAGLAIGSGAIVVMDESVDIVEYCRSVMAFFVHESCGKCTPCRLGTQRTLELLDIFIKGEAQAMDLEKLQSQIVQIQKLSACGLGRSCGKALISAMEQRYSEFESHVKGKERRAVG